MEAQKSKTVVMEIPIGAFSALKKEPDEFIREMKYAAAVKWYELGEISQSKAAEITGLSRHEFIALLKRYQVSVIQYTEKALDKELAHGRG